MSALSVGRILVPVDLSLHSALALKWAALWQQKLGGTVTVGHAISFEPPPTFTAEQLDDLRNQAEAGREAREEEVLNFLAHTLGGAPAWKVLVAAGDPVQHIFSRAAEADLVIMGTHGRTGVRRWMLGSVAEEVVQAQRLPVLVARASEHEAAPNVRRILAPTNLTPTGQRGIEAAAELAAAFDAELIVAHVYEPGRSLEEACEEVSRCAPSELLDRIAVREVVREGKPAEVIIRLAEKEAVDLIVMGSSPKPFLDFHLLPNTIQQVLRFGDSPVLVVPNTKKGS